jgi:hypothetical protein
MPNDGAATSIARKSVVLLVFAFVIACISVRVGTVGVISLLPLAFALFLAAELFGGAGRLLGAH